MIDKVYETRPGTVRVAAGTYKPQSAPKNDGTNVLITPADLRDVTFVLRDGVKVLGGYSAAEADAGTTVSESIRQERFKRSGVPSSEDYRAVLSGDIDNAADDPNNLDAVFAGTNMTGNAYHVVLAAGSTSSPLGYGTVLDGFTIEGGNADGSGDLPKSGSGFTVSRGQGGGIHITGSGSSPVFTNVTIRGNRSYNEGGGVITYDYSSSVFANVTISGNASSNKNEGGILISPNCSLVLTNAAVTGNKAKDHSGGIGLYQSAAAILINTVISGNEAAMGNGGGINDARQGTTPPPLLINVTIAGNKAGATYTASNASRGGGAISSYNWGLVIRNSIIYGNTSAYTSALEVASNIPFVYSNSILNDASPPTGTVNTDPAFAGPIDPALAPTAGGDYTLDSSTSPAINTGDYTGYPDDWTKWNGDSAISSTLKTTDFETVYNAYIQPSLEKDAAGNPRQNATIDRGAYEY
jgi:hypothetical protein